MIWLKRSAFTLLGILGLSVVGLVIYQHVSDGPTGPLSGGTFATGKIVSGPIDDWSILSGDFEFELVGEGTSRTAGGIWVEDQLYISCDLGFIWGRLPSGMQRNILHTIWFFKDWHERALDDGRIRIRKNGRIYSAKIERVTDEVQLEKLKVALEALAGEFFGEQGLGPRPTEAPNDIWFFTVKP